ncbi:hypothetical protein JB92DRAFT_675109 [Gautieria morchelliformis]|nr:hypothetical protein JB92DRAFT_675109 [Gautieria morchelliformis]
MRPGRKLCVCLIISSGLGRLDGSMGSYSGTALHPPSSLYLLNIYHRSAPRCFRFQSTNVSGALHGGHGARNYVRLWRYAYPEFSLGNDVCT